MLFALFPVLAAAVAVLLIIIIKAAEMRANKKRRAAGKEPLTHEKPIVNVIDWTRRN